MMTPACITIGEGTWRSYRLPIKPLIMMMITMMMIVISRCSTITLKELSPAGGLTFEEGEEIRITCGYSWFYHYFFTLLENGNPVVYIYYRSPLGEHHVVNSTRDFECHLFPHLYEIVCTTKKPICSNATSYRCSLGRSISDEKILRVKSRQVDVVYAEDSPKPEIHNTFTIENFGATTKNPGYLCRTTTELVPGSRITFRWRVVSLVKPFNEAIEEKVLHTKYEVVTVPTSDKCHAKISSFYMCSNLQDVDFFSYIECSVLGQTQTISKDMRKKHPCSTGSCVANSRWVLVVKLILLPLVVAISR